MKSADANSIFIHSVEKPYKPTGGMRVLGGNLSPEYSAVLKLAGVEGGLENNRFVGRARIFSAVYGAGMHPDRQLWVPEPRDDKKSGFVPQNKHREGSQKAF